ncbi:monooxygenase 2-like isoform X1 [Syzygium oleosum]|uniref:monooxygenase 2-like isoform X1 n=1 Tax=Syzygium oleosum TaxID=219896 RepID=UPI0011D212EE|nr:monooxygenase 2-like isoform X1 [Syzygium oleosum]
MEEVVIVGAGIAGLATAVALKKVGVRALILERSKELRATGAALGLFPNAWVALDKLGVSDKLAALYAPFERGYITDVKTKSIQEVHYPRSNRNGAQPRAVHRKVLLEVLAEELPPNSIRFSSKITSIETQVEQGSPICIVTLDDGSIIKSKVVIGCDGVHSIVARWLGLRPPVYSGRSAVRGLSVFPKGHGYDQSHGIHQFVDVGKRAGFITLNDKEVYWFFGATCPPKGLEKGADPEMIQREVIENLAKDFPSVFLDVVKHSDLSSLTWAPLMFRYPWNILFGKLARSNVTVAGDAMHPMTPDLGQGGCSALEDAVVLGRHLGDSISKHGKLVTQDIGFAMERYAKERRLRAATLITASYLSGWVQQDGSSRLMKFLRDVVFYKLLLARVVNSITEYDCGKLPSVSSLPSRESESSI